MMKKVFPYFSLFGALLALLFWSLTAAADGKPRELADLKEGDRIDCSGNYSGHLQGIATDGISIYWSFSEHVVRTDLSGKLLAKVKIPFHGGDPCWYAGRLYVPIGEHFNSEAPKGKAAKNLIYVFDQRLKLVRKYRLPGFKYGAGGVAAYKGHFFVAGGRPADLHGNTVWEYSANFKKLRRHELAFDSEAGIQTINRAFGKWYFGCYGTDGCAVVADDGFKIVERVKPPLNVGMIPLAREGLVLVGEVKWKDKEHSTASAVVMHLRKDAAKPASRR